MPTIQSVRLRSYGGPQGLSLEEIERPSPGPGQVLVRVAAASVNPLDWKIRDGLFQAFIKLDLPVVVGCDLAGVVEVVGDGVQGFAAGDAVYAMVGQHGAFAQSVVVDAVKLALKPANASLVEAGAMPLAALTAWQAMVVKGEVKAGQTVLIHAASGGVGGFAVQFAKHAGCHVVATTSAANAAYVRSLGADAVIDYRTTPFETATGDIDVVLDLVGGDTLERSWSVLKPGGVIVSAAGAIDPQRAAAANARGERIAVSANGEHLAQIAKLYDAGAVTVHLAKVYPLDQAAEAQEAVKTGRTRGKVVVTVD